jgi:hypothetical protein
MLYLLKRDNSLFVIVKFCNPFYAIDVSLACGTHLGNWHVVLNDIQGDDTTYFTRARGPIAAVTHEVERNPN